ncbi:MAG: sigma-70 family RNA polymerase sigma factor [Cyanobacteria bacterium P01_E01_bin.6]
MRSRERLVDIFSTFIEFQSDSSIRWVVDARLYRSMQRQIAEWNEPQTSARFWVEYWYLLWQQGQAVNKQNNLARGHLAAYLQEPCFWSATRFRQLLPQGVFSTADCFQIAIAEIDKILAGYDIQRATSLKSYASLAYPRLLRDIFRQRKDAEISTNPTLLRRVGKRVFLEALSQSGQQPQMIECYRLAWMCFKTVVQRELSQSSHSSLVDWESVSALYNAERLRQLDGSDIEASTAIDASTAEQWLTLCSKWVRAYLYPPIASLNVSFADGSTGEWQDAIADPLEKPLDKLIDEYEIRHRQMQHKQLSNGLVHAISTLSTEQQQLLWLYYGKNLTQRHIAEQMRLQQYSVSRQLGRARDSLLLKLAAWSQDSLHIILIPDLIRSMSTLLEEWLRAHYESTQEPLDYP